MEVKVDDPINILNNSTSLNVAGSHGVPLSMLMISVEVNGETTDPEAEEELEEDIENKAPNLIQILYNGRDFRLRSVVCIESSDRKVKDKIDLRYAQKARAGNPKRNSINVVNESYFIALDESMILKRNPKARMQLVRHQPYEYFSGQNKLEWLIGDIVSYIVSYASKSEQLSTIDAAWRSSILGGKKKAMFGVCTLYVSLPKRPRLLHNSLKLLMICRAEVFPRGISIDDIDQVSQVMSDFLDSIGRTANSIDQRDDTEAQQTNFEVFSLATPQSFSPLKTSQAAGAALALVSIYDDFLGSWISTLPVDAPPILRVLQEATVRQASLRIFLQCHAVQALSNVIEKLDENEPEASQGLEADLPVRVIEHKSQTPIPFDSQPGTDITRPDFLVLKKYCHFDSLKQLDTHLQKVINRWSIGGDPRLLRQNGQAESQVRLSRKQEKKKKRAETADASQRSVPLTAAPEVEVSSQPMPSSQVMGAPPRPMSDNLHTFPQAPGTQSSQGTQSKQNKKRRREGF